MKIIAVAALTGAALLTAALPASADDGPLDFGIFQGVNDTKGSGFTGSSSPSWKHANNGPDATVPESALTKLVGSLMGPGQQ
ncbi:hypothetical protein J7F01_18590 [Streptomyces sp. ISL-22]|uniref:hypothetical protein n=1 Tax=unclassified Streptomyces TaxID=2593676 RepID=UPI001BEB9742|nr:MULTISPECIES: hypothetical protein [unclassified Streptomyces]MBT2423165.1 hypothetical protein [Streptomyces sp. ISL-24]MBT2434150.1 hypothetical protein [Streptomyces sp. ISL-22]